MYILMDLVVNHCSDEHEWFQQAIKDPGRKGIWKFLFISGTKRMIKLPATGEAISVVRYGKSFRDILINEYLHVFHKKQPDLNWENPEVRGGSLQNIRWWMEKGLGGFRIDAIINIKKKLPFSDYPADRADGLCSVRRMLEGRQKGLENFWERWRSAFIPMMLLL